MQTRRSGLARFLLSFATIILLLSGAVGMQGVYAEAAPSDSVIDQLDITLDEAPDNGMDVRVRAHVGADVIDRLIAAGFTSLFSSDAFAKPSGLKGGHGHGGPPPATSDLVPQTIVLGTPTVVANGALRVTWNLTNQGIAAADATSTTAVRINQSTTSAAGADLATVATSALGPATLAAQSADLTVPSTPGTYYVWIVANSTGTVGNQSSTANDAVRSAAFTITTGLPPVTSDLLPGTITLGAASVVANGALHVTWSLANQGAGAANNTSATAVRINQSAVSAAGANSTTVATPALAAGASAAQSADLTVPGGLGTYYVWIVADSTGSVTNQNSTANDAQRSAAFTVVATLPPPIITSAIHLDLRFADATTVSFDENEATDLGDYNSPFVHQHNHTVVKGPWSVSFRPDADGQRCEAVVEYGTLFKFTAPGGTAAAPVYVAPKTASGAVPTDILTPFTATISGCNLPAPVVLNVPNQFWMSRWRWQSAPRPLVRTCQDLYDLKAILKLDPALKYNSVPPPKTAWTGPMQTAGLTRGMGAPGSRPDIGMTTGQFAGYCLVDLTYEGSWRAQAESTGTMSMWVRDVDTGALVDLSRYLYPAFDDADHGGHRHLIPDVIIKTAALNRFVLDAAHFPGVAFPAAMLTDDPYYWEAAQAIANYSPLQSNYNRLNEHLPMLVSISQPRSWAWGMRNIAQNAGFSPVTVPTWMLPRSYWQDHGMSDNRKYAQKYLVATTPATTVFKTMPRTDGLGAFMLDYQCDAFGWLGSTGLWPEWDAVVDYIATPRLVMSDPSNADGWDHRIQEPYYYPISDTRKGALATGSLWGAGYNDYRIEQGPYMPTSWAEAFSYYPAWGAANPDESKTFVDPSLWPTDGLAKASDYYPEILAGLGALNQGKRALSPVNAARTRTSFDWLKAQVDKQALVKGAEFQFAISP